MSIVEQIGKAAKALPAADQRKVLRLAVDLRRRRNGHVAQKSETVKKSRELTAAEIRKLHPAVRAIAGLWKDRTDLPEDTVEASRYLRRRLMRRGRSA